MTLKDNAERVAGKIEKVLTGFDHTKEQKNPGEMEVAQELKASNNALPHIDHQTDEHLYQVPAPGQEHQPDGLKQSRDKPFPTD